MVARLTEVASRGTDKPHPFRVRAVDDFEDLYATIGPQLAEILQVIESANPGTLAKVRASGAEATLRTRARALDSSFDLTNSTAHALDPFITQVIATDRDLDLVRASCTSPRGKDDRASVMAAAHDLIARVRAEGATAGGWLVRDRRHRKGNADHHVYGLLAIDRESRAAIRDAWISRTGAARRSVDLVTVSGWKDFVATGDPISLRKHLRNVTAYAFHDLPPGEVRDLATDVASCGPLGGAWRAFQRVTATLGRSPLVERLTPMGIIRSTSCGVCGASLADRKAGATFCSDRCRMKARDRSKERAARRKGSAR